jgi:hypothetical protein
VSHGAAQLRQRIGASSVEQDASCDIRVQYFTEGAHREYGSGDLFECGV